MVGQRSGFRSLKLLTNALFFMCKSLKYIRMGITIFKILATKRSMIANDKIEDMICKNKCLFTIRSTLLASKRAL